MEEETDRRMGKKMKAKWKGGIRITDSSGRIAVLTIVLTGNKEQCDKQADDVRSFVECLWTMGINATMLQWVETMTDDQWEIVNALRMLALGHGGITCAKAANEIERLEQELEKYRQMYLKSKKQAIGAN